MIYIKKKEKFGQFCPNTLLAWNCYAFFPDATEGTGFCAVKLTALGRPQLLVCRTG